MKKELICIICPRGCSMTAEITGETVKVEGNSCPKGVQYANDELLHPTRTVTSSVRAENRTDTMVSVKTREPISKENIFDLMELLRGTAVTAPVKIGETIIENVFGTDIIATKTVM